MCDSVCNVFLEHAIDLLPELVTLILRSIVSFCWSIACIMLIYTLLASLVVVFVSGIRGLCHLRNVRANVRVPRSPKVVNTLGMYVTRYPARERKRSFLPETRATGHPLPRIVPPWPHLGPLILSSFALVACFWIGSWALGSVCTNCNARSRLI